MSTIILQVACSEHEPSLMSVDAYKTEAMAAVESYDVNRSLKLNEAPAYIFVDVREAEEIAEKGMIKGAIHIPRGVLEFHIDPQSSMHQKLFSSGKQVIFYCASGGRSLLAAKLASEMGVPNPVYLEGGFDAWSAAGGLSVPALPNH